MEIKTNGLSMVYPTGKKALQGVDLTLKSPSLIGLVGPNGAGKSTLMKLLVGGLAPTSGELTLDGVPLRDCERHLKARLGYLPQSFGLYDELTVYQFLDYMAALKGLGKGGKAAIDTAIAQANLEEKRRARIRTLSGGQRQRVGIAQALLGTPELLIFDEPTVGLDPEERISFRTLFSRSAGDKIVLLSTHIVEDVQSVCGRLIVMDHGRVLFDGTPEALILAARGHVGVCEQPEGDVPDSLRVTARVNTAHGITWRIVGEGLPGYASPVEPTLEDAYMYLLSQGGDNGGRMEKIRIA